MNGIDPYAYLNQVSVKMAMLTQCDQIETVLCDNDFPIYGIREDWSDEKVTALMQRYIDWVAPSLLTLPSLEDSRRARLESRHGQQARSIEYHWRLYPKVLDAKMIAAARVQAKLSLTHNSPNEYHTGDFYE